MVVKQIKSLDGRDWVVVRLVRLFLYALLLSATCVVGFQGSSNCCNLCTPSGSQAAWFGSRCLALVMFAHVYAQAYKSCFRRQTWAL